MHKTQCLCLSARREECAMYCISSVCLPAWVATDLSTIGRILCKRLPWFWVAQTQHVFEVGSVAVDRLVTSCTSQKHISNQAVGAPLPLADAAAPPPKLWGFESKRQSGLQAVRKRALIAIIVFWGCIYWYSYRGTTRDDISLPILYLDPILICVLSEITRQSFFSDEGAGWAVGFRGFGAWSHWSLGFQNV